MAIRTKARDIPVVIDPLSFMADIEILGGNIAQTFNQDSKEYEPDRKLVPCILMPSVSIVDSDKVMTGKQPISGCEWYVGAPLKDGSNRIANNEFYELSAEGEPEWSLKIKKNIEPNVPIDIHAIFTVVDTRRGTEVKFERNVSLYTSLYDTKVYSLKLMDQPEGWVIDPLRVIPDENGKWNHTITAQLFSGKEKVADTNAAYWWQIYENSVWRDITQDELNICIGGKDTHGHWTKSLTFDARFFRKATFRCRAAYYSGTRPSVPKNDALQVKSSVKVEFPKTLRVDIRQTAGAKVNAAMTTPVAFECVLYDNMNLIGADKDYLFRIEWYAKSAKPGVAEKNIGIGRSIRFVPTSLGFDKLFSIAVYAEVKAHAVTALVTDKGKILTSGGKAVTAIKYE